MRHLTLERLEKRYGEVTALAGIDLEVEPGESLVILGPSGSGKSTLLRVIAGLITADGGEVAFDGVRQNDLAAHERGVSLVFQNFALYPHLTAERNITLGLRHGLGLSRQEARARAEEVAELLDISELLPRRPTQMSGGQQQRVALARALARQAGIVLLDEPLSGLDAQLKQRLRVEIGELLRSVGTTTLHVTHDQDDAMAMGDRIAVMRDGRVEQHGTPQEIYAQPASTFVARFVGAPPMNLVPVEARDGRLTGPIRCAQPLPVADGPLTVGMRPEQLVAGGDPSCTVEGEVLGAQLTQGAWTVELRTDDGEQVRGTVPMDRQPAPGERIELGADPSALHLFAEDGQRLAGPVGAADDRS